MDRELGPAGERWPQVFHHLIISNIRHWRKEAQRDVGSLLPEVAQVLRGLSYALALPEAWPVARDLMLQLNPHLIRRWAGADWQILLREAIDRSRMERDPAEIEFRLYLATRYRLQHRLSKAEDCLHQALDLCRQSASSAHRWAVITQLALVARLSLRYDEALAYCRQVLAASNLPEPVYAEVLNVMGLVAHGRQQWQEALAHFEQSLSTYRALEEPYQIARLLTNRGVVLRQLGRWDEAEANYREAIRLFQASGDQIEQFKAVQNLGNIFLMRQAYEAAIRQYQQAVPVFERCNYLVDKAHAYNNLGMAYAGMTAWETAEIYFRASIEAWRVLENSYNLANVLDNLGAMFGNAGRQDEARQCWLEALSVVRMDPENPANVRLRQNIEKRVAQLEER